MFGNSELSYLNVGVLVCYVRENLGSPAVLTVIKMKLNVQCDRYCSLCCCNAMMIQFKTSLL